MQIHVRICTTATVHARRIDDAYCATAMKEKLWYNSWYRVRRTKDTGSSELWLEKFKKAHSVGIVVLMLNRRMAGLMDRS